MEEHQAPAGGYETLWRRQWQALHTWIAAERILDQGEVPSALDGWTVRDLVAHLGRSFETAMAAHETQEPAGTLLQYIGRYRDSAADIEATARAYSSERGESLDWLDTTAEKAFAWVAATTTAVLRGPRGPISRDDFVMTRIVELVVHGDDLRRSLPETPNSPLVDEAVGAVARALAQGYAEIAGTRPPLAPGLAWIRVATGRVASTDPHLPLL